MTKENTTTSQLFSRITKQLKQYFEIFGGNLIVEQSPLCWKVFFQDSLIIKIIPHINETFTVFELRHAFVQHVTTANVIKLHMAMNRIQFNPGKNKDELVPTESTALIKRNIKILNTDKMLPAKLITHIGTIVNKGSYYSEKIVDEIYSQTICAMN
ncbi:MAG: hypothetical protein F9K42_05385 [Ignavibacterium sp.]|nr:MAG: hypothetical protein F9K42_05385 [Ignavibacterium sp.]